MLVVTATGSLLLSVPPAATAAPFDQSYSQPSPIATPGDADDLIELPPLSAEAIARLQRLYHSGLVQGNDPNSFILIGDSNTELPEFFRSFDGGNYDLGEHIYLQPLIDDYNSTGAFGADYPSSEHGMTLNMLMDPAFVNPAVCPDAENLLDCAIQLYRPSVAIIYMGTYDTCHTPFDVYVQNFHNAMRLLTARGVIAIMTTYAVALEGGCWESTPAYTAIIRDMAFDYHMPLIDLPAYTQSLPDQGMEPDGWHLSYPRDYFTSFAGGEAVYGNTLRELLTLQMLYLLRHDVMNDTTL
ncbi:MAG: SGNH/GDSL hydrolase family protein [Chloroflexi bacterium]|nr:SGNH/GDSL hydrolase family protein [Chloroflexota bacterium]